jgi:hypothetical protein
MISSKFIFMDHTLGQLWIWTVAFMKTKHLLSATDIRRLYTIQHTGKPLHDNINAHLVVNNTDNVRTVSRNINARSCNHCWNGKALSITYCNSVTAVLYCPLWPVWLYHTFQFMSQTVWFSGQLLLNIKCVFLLQLLSGILLILRRIERDIIIDVHICT